MTHVVSFAAATAASLLLAAPTPAQAAPPNIVLIFVDDQGYGDVACFGSETIATPALDRMAREGTRFTSFYSASAVCSPSRAALMTGCYPPRIGVTKVLFPRDAVGLHPGEQTMPELLKSKGYATACVGKWHLGHAARHLPTSHGFDSYFGIPYSNDMDGIRNKKEGRDGTPTPGRRHGKLDYAYDKDDWTFWNVPLMRDEEIVERPANQVTLTRRYTRAAVEFIEHNRERPFFLYLAHTMPHIPLFASEKFKGKSKGGRYGDVIEEIDASVGAVLDAVRANGLAERTVVVYTSDNGPWLSMKHHGGSAGPLRGGKFSTWEGGMRVPAFAWGPGRVPAGRECAEPIGSIDLLPTFARLAGAGLPERAIDGRDAWPVIAGRSGAKSARDAYYFYKGTKLEAVRVGNHKLRLPVPKKKKRGEKGPAPIGPAQLHDVVADIGEKADIAEQHPELVAELTALAKRFDADLKASARPIGK